MPGTRCDVLIVGGGTGGCAAAMAATSLGLHTIMVEETDWIGGQLTSQGVPPDEHPWIEEFGCTQRYRTFRELVRDYYRSFYPLTERALKEPFLNPGRGWVSKLCFEPKVGVAVLEQMLAFPSSAGLLQIRRNSQMVSAEVSGDRILAIEVHNQASGSTETIEAKIFIDSSELGELLELAKIEHVIGAESRKETGEPHAVDGPAQPLNQQGFTWCFAMGFDPEEGTKVEAPAAYEFWKDYRPEFWPGPLLSWTTSQPITHEPKVWTLFPPLDGGLGLFDYRQIISRDLYGPGVMPGEVTAVNWPQNDYWLKPLVGVPADTAQQALSESRELSLSLIYWLQNEGGEPGVTLRPEVFGTPDGFAKAPYVRESRRIQAMTTVIEQHVSTECNPGLDRAPGFRDSVGVGCYRIDLHPTTSGDDYLDISTVPFEIPLGALIPVRAANLIAGCKNIGTTHITNGCFRLHPVEWNIGESAGTLAAFCLLSGRSPRDVLLNGQTVGEFQELLLRQGIEIHWPADVMLRPV